MATANLGDIPDDFSWAYLPNQPTLRQKQRATTFVSGSCVKNVKFSFNDVNNSIQVCARMYHNQRKSEELHSNNIEIFPLRNSVDWHPLFMQDRAWQDFGVTLSTTSNEACKLYDATLSQYAGWYDDSTLGGLEASVGKLIEADPNFVMGHVLSNGLDALGTGRPLRLDQEFQQSIQTMVDLADKQKISNREKKHVQAVKLWAEGEMYKATDMWEDILLDNPLDMLALKFAHDSYFYLGLHPQMRDSIARVLPSWKRDMPLYGYLLGMHAFGLEETNFYGPAEKAARQSLDINRNDAWATHAMAHVMEMMGRQDEGISFMKDTENDWSICDMIACHNYWHYGVYNIEKGNYEEALGTFDQQIKKRSKNSGALLDLVDACSLLFRLEMEGVNVKDRWADVFDMCKSHLDDHILSFNDTHMLMACVGAGKEKETQHLLDSLRDFVKNGKGDNCWISRDVGLPLCEAIVAYDNKEYGKAFDLMYPVRYRIIQIGGSHAQRDIYNQLLIQAALKSSTPDHNRIARILLTERKTLKDSAPLTDRLIFRAMAQHGSPTA